MWALTGVPGISRAVINAHRDMALLSLFGLAFTGVAAWIELWRFRHLGRFSNRSLYLVLAFAIITLGVMAETGHRGGQINHPEIRVATEILPTDPKAGWSPAIESLINHVIWFVPWQTVHFFGFSLIFGTALAVSLRSRLGAVEAGEPVREETFALLRGLELFATLPVATVETLALRSQTGHFSGMWNDL